MAKAGRADVTSELLSSFESLIGGVVTGCCSLQICLSPTYIANLIPAVITAGQGVWITSGQGSLCEGVPL